jgi:cell division protein FtsL
MRKINDKLKSVLLILCALCIPILLLLNGFQASKYKELEDTVNELEEKQDDLIEKNKKLITEISILSNSDRIEKIAEEELGMREAKTEEIIRVEMKGKKK